MRWVVVLIIAASICWMAPAWVALLFVGGYLLAHRIEILQDRVRELERNQSDHWEDEAELKLSAAIVQALSERHGGKPAEDPDPNSVEGTLRQIEREEDQERLSHEAPTGTVRSSSWAIMAWFALVAASAWFLL